MNGAGSNLANIATQTVLPAAIGYLAGQILSKQLTFLSNNPMVGNLVKIGGGIFLAGQGKGMVSGIGAGIAINGAADLVLPALQKSGLAGINLLPPGAPNYGMSGLRGTPEKTGVVVETL